MSRYIRNTGRNKTRTDHSLRSISPSQDDSWNRSKPNRDQSRNRSTPSRDHSRNRSTPSRDHSRNRSKPTRDQSRNRSTPSRDHSRNRSTPSRDHSRNCSTPSQDYYRKSGTPSQDHTQTHGKANRDHSREYSTSHRKHHRNGKSSSLECDISHKSTITKTSHDFGFQENRHVESLQDRRFSTHYNLRKRRESDINHTKGSGDSGNDSSMLSKNIRQRHVQRPQERNTANTNSNGDELERNRTVGSHKRPYEMEGMRVTVQKRQKLTAGRKESNREQTCVYSQAVRTHTLRVYSAESLVKHTSKTKITHTEPKTTITHTEPKTKINHTEPKTKINHTEPSSFTYDCDIEYGVQTLEMLFGCRAPLDINHPTGSGSYSDLNCSTDLEDDGSPYTRNKRGSRKLNNECVAGPTAHKQRKAERIPTNGSSSHDNWSLTSAVDNNHSLCLQSEGWRRTTFEEMEISSFLLGRGRHDFETIDERHEETEVHIHDHSQAFSDFDCEEVMAGRKNLNKNAISAFEEYGVQHRLPPKVEVVSSSGPPHRPLFIAVAKLGDSEICNEKGHSKHEARIKAAERALQMLTLQQDVKAVEEAAPSESQPVESLDEDITNPVPYKDPVSALMEFAQFSKLEVNFDLISQEGPPHMPVFTMAVKLGDEVCPSVKGGSAKETKKRAACLALNKLKRQGALQTLFPDTKASAVPGGKLKSKSTLGAPGKNPVSVLNEYAQKSSTRLRFESSQTGPPHKPVFTVWAVLGEESFPEVRAASKKEGNVLAAEEVLKILEERGTYKTPKAILGQLVISSNSVPTLLTHHDRVAAAAVRKFEELLLQTPESLVGRKVIAAIVMMDVKQGLYRVVSVGSGNRCVKGSHITHDGTVLHDSHAEVLARRGFKRFLYWLLKTRDLPILVSGRHGKQRFKDGISFHLYISTAPCGDGALFTHSDRGLECSSCLGTEHCPVFSNIRTQGLLRAKQENGEGTIPVEPEFVGQTYDGIQQGGRLRVMSCSDKICQWNVLGLQGAMLSSFYEPIYLQSITLGSLFNAGHLARAVCCRIDYGSVPLQSQLPVGYHVNHPNLGVPSYQDPTRVVEKARSLSINWCFGDKEPEITDGTIGKTVKTVDKTVGPSRLCKKSLFDLYREICSKKCFTNISYKQVKLDADCYNQAKMALHKRLQEKNYGFWVCMPREVDRFL